MIKVAIDAGHGLHTPGKRTPDGEREWVFNDVVARAVISDLKLYEGVQVLRVDDPTGNVDIPLQTRTNRANDWKAHVYVSIHHNALTGAWGQHGGVETYTLNHPRVSKKSVDIAKMIHPNIVQSMGLKDRGIKQANFHVLRDSKMPAILIEGGFMDSTIDIVKLRNQQFLRAQGKAISQGLITYFNLTIKSNKGSDVMIGESHEEAWNWAKNKKLLNGEHPEKPVTRAQLATVLKRFYTYLASEKK